jgi:hypothetical protein
MEGPAFVLIFLQSPGGHQDALETGRKPRQVDQLPPGIGRVLEKPETWRCDSNLADQVFCPEEGQSH